MTVKSGTANNAKWGGAIFIYSYSHTVKTKVIFPLIKEISNVEHEYINIAPQLTVLHGAYKLNKYCFSSVVLPF